MANRPASQSILEGILWDEEKNKHIQGATGEKVKNPKIVGLGKHQTLQNQ